MTAGPARREHRARGRGRRHHRLRRRRRHDGLRAHPARHPVRGARGRRLPQARGLRERRVGRLQPDGVARPADRVRQLAARDRLPDLPAWIVKAVGGSTTHWSGATPRFRDYEFRARSYYGGIEGANLIDWPIGLADLAPYYDRAEQAIGSSHRHGRPPLPANNNYKVFANGAETDRLQVLRHRPLRDERRAVRRAAGARSRTASTSKGTRTRPSGRRRCARFLARSRPVCATFARSRRPCRSSTTGAGV